MDAFPCELASQSRYGGNVLSPLELVFASCGNFFCLEYAVYVHISCAVGEEGASTNALGDNRPLQ